MLIHIFGGAPFEYFSPCAVREFAGGLAVWRGQATPSDSKKTKKSKANCSKASLKSSLRTLESCPNNVADWRATRFIAGTMQNQNAKLVANRQQQQNPTTTITRTAKRHSANTL